jgi:hypothetical protein
VVPLVFLVAKRFDRARGPRRYCDSIRKSIIAIVSGAPPQGRRLRNADEEHDWIAKPAYEDGFILLELTRKYYREAGFDVRDLDLLIR